MFKSITLLFFFFLASTAVFGQRTGDEIPDLDYDPNPSDPQDEISQIEDRLIGSWLLENDHTQKIVFTSDNKVKRYSNGVLKSTNNFLISNSCGGETLTDSYFLVTVLDADTNSCAYLDNVDFNGSGILTLMTSNQGKIIIYERE